MNLPPIPSDRPGSASRFKGVRKRGKKWGAEISIPSEGGHVFLGTFDSEEEAGIMYAQARYKYPMQKGPSTPSKRPRVSYRLIDTSTLMEGSDTSDSGCMVCGLSSDPELVLLLCDGCANEAHVACVGLTQVPTGDWFCASCRGRSQPRTATVTDPSQRPPPHRHRRGRPEVARPAFAFHHTQREPGSGELDEVDGIVIEAFAAGPSSLEPRSFLGRSEPRSQCRPKKRAKTRRTSTAHRQQPRPPQPPGQQTYRHQLFSGR